MLLSRVSPLASRTLLLVGRTSRLDMGACNRHYTPRQMESNVFFAMADRPCNLPFLLTANASLSLQATPSMYLSDR